MSGNYDKAIAHFGNGDAQDPFNWTGVAYEGKGQGQEAIQWFRKVTQSNDNSYNLAMIRTKAMQKLRV